jgi:hypothetical protein
MPKLIFSCFVFIKSVGNDAICYYMVAWHGVGVMVYTFHQTVEIRPSVLLMPCLRILHYCLKFVISH